MMLFILKREGVTTTAFSLSYTPPPPFLFVVVCVCVCWWVMKNVYSTKTIRLKSEFQSFTTKQQNTFANKK